MDQRISVIMPVFNQARFVKRAIESLRLQTIQLWELLIINDGSTDNLKAVIAPYLADRRIKYFENKVNVGLGASLNTGLAKATANFIAYLPADDIYYRDHLETLLTNLEQGDHILAYGGVRYNYNRFSNNRIEGYSIQLVQVMHRKTADKWMERDELVTDDLDRMFWNKLAIKGKFITTESITCEWVSHPHQRHKIILEPEGGINPYKLYYGVKQPLRFHSTMGNYIDEIGYFNRFRNREDTPKAKNGLKIVLCGELAYNSERVLALEEHGHKLYGLWMKDPYWYNSVGPLPFGHVEDIPRENWKERLAEIEPDIIYAQLNWQAVPFAYEVLTANTGIPFVWHFKEGPFICMEKGTWPQLIDLYNKSDGQIYNSAEMRDWFLQFVDDNAETTLLLDGDLPKKEWFTNDVSPRLSTGTDEIHTVVPGRPIGLHPHTVAELAEQKIHLHFYGDFTHGQWKQWIVKTESMAPGYLHIHPNVTQEHWVKEFSQYDAGWLHFFKSENFGELMRANWDDLNYPARMSTLACAGLPMLQRDNTGHLVATQSLVKEHNLGIFFNTMDELGATLRNREQMEQIRQNVWNNRLMFCFDNHADRLVEFFRTVIRNKKSFPVLTDNLSVTNDGIVSL